MFSEEPPKSKRAPRTPYTRALDLLALRAHSVKELTTKLKQKGMEPADVETVINRLLENGLLNDKAFATLYARSRLSAGKASTRRIEQDLMKRGISTQMAREAIQTVIEEEGIDTLADLEKVAERRAQQLAKLDPQVARRRLYGFLVRRGYNMAEVQEVVNRVLAK